MSDDDASVDTTDAVSEFRDEKSRGNESNGAASKVVMEVEAAPSRKVALGLDQNNTGVQFDDKPVYKKAGMVKDCPKKDCANYGGECHDHGKVRMTCRVTGCESFRSMTGGFCNAHYKVHGQPSSAESTASSGENRGPKSGGKQFCVTQTNGDQKSKKKREKKKKKKGSALATGPTKEPPLLGPTRADIVLGYRNEEYKQILHESFREMEKDESLSAKEVGERIFKDFCAQLDKSGGSFMKKKEGGEYVTVDREDALKETIIKDIYRRTDTTHIWSNASQEGAESGEEEPAAENSLLGPSRVDIVLSLSDEKYKSIWQEKKKEMTAGKMTRVEAGTELWQSLCSQLDAKGSFMKKKKDGTYCRISREDARDFVKRSIYRVRDGGNKAKEKTSGKRKSDERPAPKKKQKRTRDSNDDSDTGSDFLGMTWAEEHPLEYVGNHIANLLVKSGEWTDKNMMVGFGRDDQVVCRKGCDRRTAVVGRDKFIGYAALARWANTPQSGFFFKNHVLTTEKGGKVLRKAGVEDDPYSIFRDDEEPGMAEGQGETGEHAGADRGGNDGADQNDGNQEPAARRASNQRASGNAVNPGAMQDPADDTSQSQGSALIKDDEAESPEKKGASSFSKDIDETTELFDEIRTRYKTAKAANDADGLVFYGHLLGYFTSKTTKKACGLGSDKDVIADFMKRFDTTMKKVDETEESDPGLGYLKNLLAFTIEKCQETFPIDP